MINNIQDLIEFQNSLYYSLGNNDVDNNLLIKTPGYSEALLQQLRQHSLEVPSSYKEIISKLNFNGSVLGPFCLTPSSGKSNNLIEKLILVNSDPFFPADFMKKHNMYQIGFCNTDLICVTAGTDQFREGEILYIEEGKDIYNPEDTQIHKIAEDFEQFLIIAGNLEEVHSQFKGDRTNTQEIRREFFNRLNILKVPEEYHKAWELFL